MGALGRVAIPVLAVAAVLWQCGRPELPPYVLPVGELDGLLGDIGRASAVLVPAVDGWTLTTATIVTDADGGAALLRIRGAGRATPAEAQELFRAVVERYDRPWRAGRVVRDGVEALDLRQPQERASPAAPAWRGRLMRVGRHVVLVEVSTPPSLESDPYGDPSAGTLDDGQCEQILARAADRLRDKLERERERPDGP